MSISDYVQPDTPTNNDYLTRIAGGVDPDATLDPRMTNNDLLRIIAEGTSGLAHLDSPALTGTPTAPTADAGDESAQIATTEFVQQEITANPAHLELMSPTTIGGAKLGDGLALTDGALGIDPEPQESTGEVRGAIASLTAKGWATQDGTPTPESPVPIQVARGRNLFRTPYVDDAKTSQNGLTFAVLDDGGIRIDGTASATTYWNLAATGSKAYEVTAGTHTISVQGLAQGISFVTNVNISGANKYSKTLGADGSQTVDYEESGVLRSYLQISSGSTVHTVVYPQLELGSTPTPYVPYGHVGVEVRQGSTLISAIPVPLPAKGFAASLPDGTADVLTIDGAGKVEWESATGMVTFDGSESWSVATVNGMAYAYLPAPQDMPSTRVGGYAGLCDAYVVDDTVSALDATVNNTMILCNRTMSSNARVVCVDTVNATSAATYKAWLTQNPITVLYPLATPVTEQCGYIDWPEMPDGAIITCPELDALGVRYLIGNGVAEMARDWYERGHAEAQATSTALGELAQSVLDVDGKADAVAAQLVAEDVFNGINLNATDVPNANITAHGSLLRVLDVVYLSLQVFTIDEDITVDVNGVTVFTFEGRAMPAGQYTTDYVFASLQTNIPGVSAYVMRSGEVRLVGDGYVIEAGTSFDDSGITITGTYPLIPSGN